MGWRTSQSLTQYTAYAVLLSWMSLCTSPQWSLKQRGLLLMMSLAHFCSGMCVSLQAPFYPAEAASKGADAFSYGLVFGVFELVVFLVSPVVGKAVPIFGPSVLWQSTFPSLLQLYSLWSRHFSALDLWLDPVLGVACSIWVVFPFPSWCLVGL